MKDRILEDEISNKYARTSSEKKIAEEVKKTHDNLNTLFGSIERVLEMLDGTNVDKTEFGRRLNSLLVTSASDVYSAIGLVNRAILQEESDNQDTKSS